LAAGAVALARGFLAHSIRINAAAAGLDVLDAAVNTGTDGHGLLSVPDDSPLSHRNCTLKSQVSSKNQITAPTAEAKITARWKGLTVAPAAAAGG
jgi:hypothetical protein